jgi:hypothetical protein
VADILGEPGEVVEVAPGHLVRQKSARRGETKTAGDELERGVRKAYERSGMEGVEELRRRLVAEKEAARTVALADVAKVSVARGAATYREAAEQVIDVNARLDKLEAQTAQRGVTVLTPVSRPPSKVDPPDVEARLVDAIERVRVRRGATPMSDANLRAALGFRERELDRELTDLRRSREPWRG